MGNKATLRPKPFTKDYQPAAEKKSRKGIPNRATVYKKFLELMTNLPNPADATKEIKVTLYEAAALGQLLAAQHGNTRAWQEIQDSLHGKMVEKQEQAGVVEVIVRHEKRKSG
jgi:hypothetical protein